MIFKLEFQGHDPEKTRSTWNYRHPNSQFLLNIAWLLMTTSKMREKNTLHSHQGGKNIQQITLKLDKNYRGFIYFLLFLNWQLKFAFKLIPKLISLNHHLMNLNILFFCLPKNTFKSIFYLSVSKSFPFPLPKDALNFHFSVNRRQFSLSSPKTIPNKTQTSTSNPFPPLLSQQPNRSR